MLVQIGGATTRLRRMSGLRVTEVAEELRARAVFYEVAAAVSER